MSSLSAYNARAGHPKKHPDLENKSSTLNYIQPLLSGDKSELIIGLQESDHEIGECFAVAVRKDDGGAIVLSIDAARMLDFRQRIGLSRLIQDIGETGEILYIALQDEYGIVVASKNLKRLERIESDKFLSRALEEKLPQSSATCSLPSLAILPTMPTLTYGRHSVSEPRQEQRRRLHMPLMKKD